VNTAAQNAIGSAAPVTKATLAVNGLNLVAAYEGSWGNKLRARVDHDIADSNDTELFNLSIRDDATGLVETFRNVSVVTNSVRRVDRVLENESNLVRNSGALPGARPAKQSDPTPTLPLWGDDNHGNANATNTKVT